MLLAGRSALVFGVANENSIAWGIAKALHEQGAQMGLSSVESLIERRVRPLAASIGCEFVEPCDATSDDDIKRVFARWDRPLDILVHSIAHARKEDLSQPYWQTSRENFGYALEISSYSLVALVREAKPYLREGSSVLTLTYHGSQQVLPNYNVMGVAKAALEASVRYLAAELGPEQIRVNAISAGPVRTLAALGVSGFRQMYRSFSDQSPLRSNITAADVGGAAVFLSSDMAKQITGEILYVDGGFHVLGVGSAEGAGG